VVCKAVEECQVGRAVGDILVTDYENIRIAFERGVAESTIPPRYAELRRLRLALLHRVLQHPAETVHAQFLASGFVLRLMTVNLENERAFGVSRFACVWMCCVTLL